MGIMDYGYPTKEDEAQHVARMMVKHGGSFVEHLGLALERADHINTARIKEAFPEYWREYEAMQDVD